MTRRYFRPIKEDTIVSVLHFLRQEAKREGFSTLHHIDALLTSRGIDPETLQTPRKTPKYFKKGELQRMVLEALRKPLTGREVVEYIDSPLPFDATYKRVYIALNRLKNRGLVKNIGGVWSTTHWNRS